MDTKKINSNRLSYIDFLKFLGLTGIILAHVSPPELCLMLRSFDVPLMVIISSYLNNISFEKHKPTLLGYYCSRLKRLAFPTWIFLTLFFICKFLMTGNNLGLRYYLYSFAFTRYGIGYVWIILIYIYSALFIPLFSKYKTNRIVIILLFALYIAYEIAYYFQIGINNVFIDTTFYYIIPYGGLLTFLGCNYDAFSKRARIAILAVSGALFIGMGLYYWLVTGSFQSVNIDKYPPRVYYLGYGVFVSFSLMAIFRKNSFAFFKSKFIVFVSKHSLWIYLWHILAISLYDVIHLPEIWIFKFFIVYAFSFILVYLINKLLDWIEFRSKKQLPFFKYLRG